MKKNMNNIEPLLLMSLLNVGKNVELARSADSHMNI